MNDDLSIPILNVFLDDEHDAMPDYGPCVNCGEPLECGPHGFIDCPACNPARS